MGYEFFASVMTPGIALLILSTTMRLGNVRMALTEIAKLPNTNLETLESYQLFRDRASYLCTGLRLLNISVLLLIPGTVIKLVLTDANPMVIMTKTFFDVSLFVVLFVAMVNLFKESQLTGRSIIAHTQDIRNLQNAE